MPVFSLQLHIIMIKDVWVRSLVKGVCIGIQDFCCVWVKFEILFNYFKTHSLKLMEPY